MRLYTIFIALLLISCNKNKQQSNDTDSILTSNSIVSLTLDKEEYITTENARFVIEPIITREYEINYDDLLFEWNINGTLRNERVLDYFIPSNGDDEILKCYLSIRNKSDNQSCRVDFRIRIINPFGLGYYFLCADEAGKSMIAHLSTENHKEIVFNSLAVDKHKIGDNPKMLTKKLIYNYPEKNYYEINIITEQGDYPYIKCKNENLRVVNALSNRLENTLFSPRYHHIDKREQESFLSDGKYLILRNNNLYSETDNSYYWSHIIEGRNHLYMFDSKSGKYYQVKPNENSYYNDIIPIINSPSMLGETTIGYHWKLERLEGDEELSEDLFILTSSPNKLNYYNLKHNSKRLSLNRLKSEDVGSSQVIAAMGEELCYIGIGSEIYTTSKGDNNLKPFLTIPNEITQMIISDDKTKLIVASYNQSDTHPMKGAILVIDINSKEVKTFDNSFTKCVSIIDCSTK